MKIKEVIEQTGLTDRAIRLYISNGLITPQCQRTYTGRNNYDFSDADVALLQRIALLRKADFTIEQIKSLQQGGEPAREVLAAYLETKREELETGQKILSALETLPADSALSLDEICAKIEEGLREKPVPQEDLKPTKWEIFEKWIMRILSIPILVFFGLSSVGLLMTYAEDFPFPKVYWSPINHIGVLYYLLPAVLSMIVLVLYAGSRLNLEKRKKRRKNAIILMLLAILIAVQPYGFAFANWMPPVYSETDDPENYMVLGYHEQMYSTGIRKLFPANIPRSAVAEGSNWYPPDSFPDTTKYYYYHQDVIDPSFDIYAEWALPEDEYAAEMQRIENYYSDGPIEEVRWGDWMIMNFNAYPIEDAAELDYYYYLIFAYNDKTSTVRYIASYAMDTGGTEVPYFLSLDW